MDTNADEFENLIREHQRMVYHIAYGVVRNQRDAEDVVQETFLRAHEHLSALRDPEKFRAWVCRISGRLALNRLRRETRLRRREEHAYAAAPSHGADVELVAEDRLFVRSVRAEIERLPARLRDVVVMTAIDGLDHAAVARILGVPAGTVRSRLFFARKALLKALDG